MQRLPSTPTSPILVSGRVDGLDTLRALAIVLVFVYHYRLFVDGAPDFGWISIVGWTGVDLFFVLSGYLISDALFKGIAIGRRLSLRHFYARRALRTLPVFWLVLAVYFSFPAQLEGHLPPPVWRFLTFTQNIDLRPGTAFSHAWSLCIEEQFYFVLPLLLMTGRFCGAGRRHGWLLMLVLLLLGIVARTVLWQAYGRESSGHIERYYPSVYYATLCRFDEFLPGIAIAMLKHFHAPLWGRLMRHGHALFVAAMIAVGAIFFAVFKWYEIDGYGYGFFMTAFGYSLVAMAFGLLVLAALSPGSWLHRWRIPGAAPLALGSYSIYLTHKGIAHVLKTSLAPFGLSPMSRFAAITMTCLLIAALIHRFIERPVMRWRHRHVGSNFERELPRAPIGAAVASATSTFRT